MEHLLTTDEAAKIGRPINGKIDHERILAYITEAEQMNIKPVLGDRLFLDILQNGGVNEQYKVLLNGGTYTAKDGGIYSFVGLKCCVAYFVFAKNVMVGDFQTTRFGVVMKKSNNVLPRYCSHVGIPTGNLGAQRASGGIKIRKIG